MRCICISAIQWILTAGVIEESFKFAILLRLRSSMRSVLRDIEACSCGDAVPLPRGWWLKLADSPLAVALCGVAAGGGLATTENFVYIFSHDNIAKAFGQNDLEAA